MSRLFIIGNGFDIAHSLPTKFDPYFKEIAVHNESYRDFWNIYSGEYDDLALWSDFESNLATPDFSELVERFTNDYPPDYLSDHEYDRDSIITQVQISGKLQDSLNSFAKIAEAQLKITEPLSNFKKLFRHDDKFISFNYTHTLEQLYGISTERVLHIHGEIGISKLVLGYNKKSWNPSKVFVEIEHGQGYSFPIEKYGEHIEDYYIGEACRLLLCSAQAFEKPLQIEELRKFLCKDEFDEIVSIGFSFGKEDKDYFQLLHDKFPKACFTITGYKQEVLNDIERKIKSFYHFLEYLPKLLDDYFVATEKDEVIERDITETISEYRHATYAAAK